MEYAIVYSSRTGNTQMLAEALHAALPLQNCRYFGSPAPQAGTAARVYVGFWTDRGDCDAETAAFLQTLHGKEVFLFGTAGFGGTQDYYDDVLHRAAQHLPPDARLIGQFMCQGKMPPAVRARYQAMAADPAHAAQAAVMLENFDRALGHPDAGDAARLCAAAAAAK